MHKSKIMSVFITFLIIFTITPLMVIGDPDREVSLYTPYNYVKVSASNNLVFTLDITNKGDITELLDLHVIGPTGWEATFVREEYIVKSLNIKSNSTLTVKLNISPPLGEDAGIFNFTIFAESRDNVIRYELEIK